MNKRKNETSDSTSRNNRLEPNHSEESEGAQEIALGDLEPRAEITGGSIINIYKVPDITLKRG